MTFDKALARVVEVLQRQGRVSYRALKARFQLDDDALDGLKDELIYAQRVAADGDGKVVVWTGGAGKAAASASEHVGRPVTYMCPHLAEKIFSSKAALEGERKPITVLFADLKGSMELLADRDPEEAWQLLDPMLERMMDAVHPYKGTVNQVMGDGIMALFGAPIDYEDHAARACYATLVLQEAMGRYAEKLRRRWELPYSKCPPREALAALGKRRAIPNVRY